MKAESGGDERLFLAYDPFGRCLVILDVLEAAHTDIDQKLEELRRLTRDARLVGHASLVGVHEVGEDDGMLYAVREFAPGEPLGEYVGRVGGRLPLSEGFALAIQCADAYLACGKWIELATSLDYRRALVALERGGELRLRLDVFGVTEGEETWNASASEGRLMDHVCDLLHFCLAGRWIPRGGKGDPSPTLGELPEPVRFLFWARFKAGGSQGPSNLGQLRELLEGLAESEQGSRRVSRFLRPVCRLRRALFEEADFEELFGGKYRRENAEESSTGLLPGEYVSHVLQEPFGYSMRMQPMPGAPMFDAEDYREILSVAGDGSAESHRHVLRVCAVAEKASVAYLIEERVNGFSLEELALRRGGFDADDACRLLESVHAALREVEKIGRTPWELSPENVLVNFETCHDGETLLERAGRSVDAWPAHSIVLRLHPTMSALVSGAAVAQAGSGMSSHAAWGREMAVLAWRLLSFCPYRSAPMPGGRYRKLDRLTSAGNEFIRRSIEECPRTDDPADGRGAFLKCMGALMRQGMFERGEGCSESESRPMPHAECPFAAVSGVAKPKARSLRQGRSRRAVRFVELPRRKRRPAPWKKLAVHLGMAATIALLGLLAYVILNPDTRPRALAVMGNVVDWAITDEPAPAAPTANPNGESAGEEESGPPVPVVLAGVGSGDAPVDAAPAPCTLDPDSEPSLASEREVAPPEPLESTGPEVIDAPPETLPDAGEADDWLRRGDLLRHTDRAAAVRFYRKAAERKHPTGMTAYADCLWNGDGVEANRDEALRLYQDAAELGNVGGMVTLARLYLEGEARVPESAPDSARVLLERAVEAGSGPAASSLGVLYLNGLGVEKDAERAAELFAKGATGGDVNGMLYFARCLNGGNGVTRNTKAARHWFRKSATGGNAHAVAWCQRHGVDF